MANRERVIGYSLRDSSDAILYFGVTNNPQRRIEEHLKDGKTFSWLVVEFETNDRSEAETWEERALADYANEYDELPCYNSTLDGKWFPH